MVVPAYTILLDHLDKLTLAPDNTTSTIGECMIGKSTKNESARAAFSKLNKYYNLSSEICTIATVLHPRLKLSFYKGDRSQNAEDPEEILKIVRAVHDRDYSGSVLGPPFSTQLNNQSFLDSLYTNLDEPEVQSELDLYIIEPVIKNHPNFHIMDYWRMQSFRFALLSKMARDYLAVPGTSTSSERAFSGGRQLITDFRCSLSGKTVTACIKDGP